MRTMVLGLKYLLGCNSCGGPREVHPRRPGNRQEKHVDDHHAPGPDPFRRCRRGCARPSTASCAPIWAAARRTPSTRRTTARCRWPWWRRAAWTTPWRLSPCAPVRARRWSPGAAAPASAVRRPNSAVVLDWTKYCHHLVSRNVEARTCVVEPGMALDELNRLLAPPRADVRPETGNPPQLHPRRHDRQQLVRFHRPGLRQDRGQHRAPGSADLRRAVEVGRTDQRRRVSADPRRGRSPRGDRAGKPPFPTSAPGTA